METGWIKIHRKISEWEWYDNPAMVQMWLHLLVEANYEQTKWHGKTIERGQLVTTLEQLSESTGLSVQQTRTVLSRLQGCNQISKKSTNKYTIITICNYDSYQSADNNDQQTNNKQTTNKQQTNLEEAKEVNNTPPIIPPTNGRVGYEFFGTFHNVMLKPVEFRQLQMNYGQAETQSAIDDLSCKLADGTAESVNHYATLVYWLTNRGKKGERRSGYKGDSSIGQEFTLKM